MVMDPGSQAFTAFAVGIVLFFLLFFGVCAVLYYFINKIIKNSRPSK